MNLANLAESEATMRGVRSSRLPVSSATLAISAPQRGIVITPRVRDCSVRRYYDPATGQFLGIDPAVDQTEQPYAYASGNPVDYVDPLGLGNWLSTAWDTVNPLSTSNVFRGVASSGGAGAAILGLNPLLPAAADFVGASSACSSGAAAKDILFGIGWTLFGAVDPEGDEAEVAAEELGNTNPFLGPIDSPGNVVTPGGDVFDLKPGESITGSPDGKWLQVRGPDGEPTGVRLDNGHPSHDDPRAQAPHIHVPGMTNPDGTPWLPAK